MFSRNRGNSVPNAGKGAKQAEPQPVPNGRAREGSVPDLLAPPPSDAQPLPRSAPGSRDTSPKLTPTQTREASSAPASPGRLSRSAQPGHEGNLSPQQAEALEKLRTRLTDEGYLSKENAPHYQETQLLRFLRARSFNVDAAATMYIKAEQWKEEIGLDRLCREFEFSERNEVARLGWRMYFHKVDRNGRPIFIQDLSNLDANKVFQVTTADRVVLNFAVTLEMAVRHRYAACTEAHGDLVDDNFMVLNIAGLGLGTFWTMKSQLQKLLFILDNNFPELSGKVQIINAPYLFSTAWACIKNWLPPQTAEKINIVGSDYLKHIYAYVDAEHWPKSLGGKCTCCADKQDEKRAAEAKENRCETSDDGPWASVFHHLRCRGQCP